jgi:hypothetical protein
VRVGVPSGGWSPFSSPSRPDLEALRSRPLLSQHLATETRLLKDRSLRERCGCTQDPARANQVSS